MNNSPEARRVNRHNRAIDIYIEAVEEIGQFTQEGSYLADLSKRLHSTPVYIWEESFKLGLDKNKFKAHSIRALELISGWGLTIDRLLVLAEACRPEKRQTTEISLNKVLPPPSEAMKIITGFFKEDAQEILNTANQVSTDVVLGRISDSTLMLGDYFRHSIMRPNVAPTRLADGSIRYALPTSLEEVRAIFIYSPTQVSPLVSVKVDPIVI